jgi:site-specific DNA-methyltransferase (adenine-specific)
MELNMVYNEDCLIGMKEIEDKSIDMILCDLPYGTTQNSWDSIIPFDELWKHYNRIIKENGAIVLTAQPPFDKVLGASNIKHLKYEWIWEKSQPTGFLNAKKQPLKYHENILVFYKKQCVYNPQITKKPKSNIRPRHSGKQFANNGNYGDFKHGDFREIGIDESYPSNIIKIPHDQDKSQFHPTSKPVKLFEYLIKTYTNENETVLDNCMGSGTTAIACLNTKRNFIGYEMDKEYFDKATKRIKEHKNALECNVGLFSNEVQKQLSLL